MNRYLFYSDISALVAFASILRKPNHGSPIILALPAADARPSRVGWQKRQKPPAGPTRGGATSERPRQEKERGNTSNIQTRSAMAGLR